MPKRKRTKFKTVQEYLNVPSSWPVIEKLSHTIMLMPNAQDIKRATPHDPQACALRNAACRIYGVPNCAIGGRWAYIPQRDERGRYYIARMQATEATQKAIRKFDATGAMPLGGFHFIPIAPSHYSAAKKAYGKKWHRGEVGHNGQKRKHTKAFKVRRIAPKLAIT